MTIMAVGVLLHWTQANSFELVVRQNYGRQQGASKQGRIQQGHWGDRSPKTYELTLLAMVCAIRKTSFAIQGHFVIHCFVTEVLWTSEVYFISLTVVNR